MSANLEVLGSSELMGSSTQTAPRAESGDSVYRWNPQDFAEQQIRGLVRRVFFADMDRPARQVIFSAAEPQLDVASICEQVARALASETTQPVALVDGQHDSEKLASSVSQAERSSSLQADLNGSGANMSDSLKSRSTQITRNLWRVSLEGFGEGSLASGTGMHWLAYLANLKNEFEYAVIHGPAAAVSSEAALLGPMTDGIILVIGAHSTRKATARKIKESLEASQSRILGTVLSQRTFPIPDRIYRRL
jgi:hypothetical protein